MDPYLLLFISMDTDFSVSQFGHSMRIPSTRPNRIADRYRTATHRLEIDLRSTNRRPEIDHGST